MYLFCLKEEWESSSFEAQSSEEASLWSSGWTRSGSSIRTKKSWWWASAWWTTWWGRGWKIGSWWFNFICQNRINFNLSVFFIFIILAFDQCHELLRVFANNDGSGVASNIVPCYSIIIFVVLSD